MRIATLALAFLVVLGLASTRRAEACGGGGPSGDAVGAIIVVGGAYVGTTLAFGVKDLVGSEHSTAYGIGEIAFNAPFTALWGAAFIESATNNNTYDNDLTKTSAVFTAIHGGLLAHGIYTVVKNRRKSNEKKLQQPIYHYGPPGSVQVRGVTAVVTPAPMANGAGIGLSGTF